MKHALLVGLGGFVGSIARFQMGALMAQRLGAAFPYGTLTVNLAGCFLVGLLAGWVEHRHLWSVEVRLLVFSGFLGGYTTFSAFGYEALLLLRRAEIAAALLYVVLSVAGGLLLAWLGFKLSAMGLRAD